MWLRQEAKFSFRVVGIFIVFTVGEAVRSTCGKSHEKEKKEKKEKKKEIGEGDGEEE